MVDSILLQTFLIGYFLVINFISFWMFGWDKFKAVAGKRRISEKALLIVTGLGGLLGSVLGMVMFGHKTIKSSFQIKFWAILIVWIVFVLYMLIK